MPGTSSAVAGALGITGGAVDLNAACAGFTYGLITAAGMLSTGARKVLLIGAETMTRTLNWEDRTNAFLFADGAGALVLEAVSGPGSLLGWDAGVDGSLVNLLYVDVPAPGAQILLKVKFASVDRSASTQLGMNLLSTGAANTIGAVSTGQYSPPGAPAVSPGTPIASTITEALNLFFFRPDLNLGATIQALQVKGLLQILSEPNVLAQDGKQSSFLAGGEFPFPSVSAGGAGSTPAVSIQFREYGVRLTFTPIITPRGTIQLQVAPEVSALDFTNGLVISGFNVPALTTRKLSTQVELNEGQSFAIGGLLDNRTTDTLEKIPFISEIPFIGKFFQSKSVSKQNTELIVIVTPELVRPIPAGQPLPDLKFTVPFMPTNTPHEMHTPGLDVTGPMPVEPPHPTIPIEKLVESLRQAAGPVPPVTAAASAAGPSASNSSAAPH